MLDAKLIMVDLDGTLVDTKDINYHAYKDALAKHGYEIDYEYFCAYCNGRHYLDFIPQIVKEESLYSDIHKTKKGCYSSYLCHARVNKFLVSLLKQARETGKVALVTTASRQNCMELLEHCHLTGLFDLILTREDVEHSKPNPEGFLKAMAHFNASPEETVVFEDSEVGMQAALAATATVYKTYGFN